MGDLLRCSLNSFSTSALDDERSTARLALVHGRFARSAAYTAPSRVTTVRITMKRVDIFFIVNLTCVRFSL